jgi:hypothetical protein
MWECAEMATLDASVDLNRRITMARTPHVAPSLAFAAKLFGRHRSPWMAAHGPVPA